MMSISTSEIKLINGHYKLFVNGKPFYLKGAGLEFGSIKQLADHGANSFRTWRTNNGQKSGKEILDEAHQYGLKVMMGIEVARERHGFDYNDSLAVQEQLYRIRDEVLELKDHPALIIWGIGNELNLSSNDINVWNAVNEISKMIHEVDAHHLTTTSLAGISPNLIAVIKSRASDLDFLSFQMYAEIDALPKLIDHSGWDGPFAFTEWGATGYWEVKKTTWGAPIEETSTQKAAHYLNRYLQSIALQENQCLGSFVFLWGQKQERTSTWFGMFTPDDRKTECVDVMHYLWNKEWPQNRCPKVAAFELNNQSANESVTLEANQFCSAKVQIKAMTQTKLTFYWEVREESKSTKEGGDKEEIPELVFVKWQKDLREEAQFYAPEKSGAYRLFVQIEDPNAGVAHANIPFYVS
ncbi:MAG: glycoside hydrolase family 2 TIM barrel-domain containing protein [Fulvivirga sp.]|uniref:glycoside hydrolase family 2 TIM barrel-domain containing protein n=1 Tax=Fulvivirga sp. TaxID=1931237 RepID=UPI0032ED983C